jgi:excinuclease ABC subunit C
VVARHYVGRGTEGARDLPREILLPQASPDDETVEGILTEEAGRKVLLLVPQRGAKLRMVELAATNARHALEDRILTGGDAPGDRAEEILFDLQDRLDLKIVPRLMVCFDISHTQGSETVGSAVVFQNAEPRKAEYRHMRIRGDWGNDDYRSMHETVHRYFRRRLDEERPIPDLAVIDGGKGQLNAALSALAELGLEDVHAVGLAKREEEVFLPGRKEPVVLDRRERSLQLLQRIRDEAHRFAVSYNRKLRRKRTIRSDLGDVPGIGPRRQQALLTRFGSVKGVAAASEEEIARVPGFSRVLAARVLTYLRR